MQLFKKMVNDKVVEESQLYGYARDELLFYVKDGEKDIKTMYTNIKDYINNKVTEWSSFIKVEPFRLKLLSSR